MNTEPRCIICDLKALHITNRDQSYTVALQFGAVKGIKGVRDVLCKGHRDAWNDNSEKGTAMLVKMIQYEAEEIRRLKEES